MGMETSIIQESLTAILVFELIRLAFDKYYKISPPFFAGGT